METTAVIRKQDRQRGGAKSGSRTKELERGIGGKVDGFAL